MPLAGMIYDGPSVFAQFPTPFADPYTEEVREMVHNARAVAVNILGPRDAYEKTHYLSRTHGTDYKVTKIKAHKVAFLRIGAIDDSDGAILAVRWIIGIAAFLLGNVSAPLMGDDFALRRIAKEEYQRVDRELDCITEYHHCKRRHRVAKSITEMLLNERKVFQILRRNAEVILVLRVALLISTSLALGGAIVVGYELLFFGAMGMFLTTSALLLKTGFDSQAYQVRQVAQQVRRHVDYLLAVNWWTRTSNMHYPIP